jgi:hypothetical protein
VNNAPDFPDQILPVCSPPINPATVTRKLLTLSHEADSVLVEYQDGMQKGEPCRRHRLYSDEREFHEQLLLELTPCQSTLQELKRLLSEVDWEKTTEIVVSMYPRPLSIEFVEYQIIASE